MVYSERGQLNKPVVAVPGVVAEELTTRAIVLNSSLSLSFFLSLLLINNIQINNIKQHPINNAPAANAPNSPVPDNMESSANWSVIVGEFVGKFVGEMDGFIEGNNVKLFIEHAFVGSRQNHSLIVLFTISKSHIEE